MSNRDSDSLIDGDVLQRTAETETSLGNQFTGNIRLMPSSSVYIIPSSNSAGAEMRMPAFPSRGDEMELERCTRKGIFGFRRMYFAALAALMNILNAGFAASYSAPATVDMKRPGRRIHGLTEDQITWIASLIGIGCILGAPSSAYLAQKFGRKAVLVCFSIPSVIGWLVIAYAPDVYWIYFGRLLTGFCNGIAIATVPSYLIEISTPEIRGFLASGYQVAFSGGVLLVMAFGAILSWSWLAVVGATIIVIGVSALYFMPESPHWLVAKGRNVEAQKAIKFLQGQHFDAVQELKAIQQGQSGEHRADFSIKEFFQPQLYKPLILSLGLMLFQQFSGVNPLMAYTVSIFEETHSSLDPSTATITVAVVQVVVTAISGLLVDKSGRRILFVVSGVFIAVGLFLLGLFEMLVKNNSVSSSSYGWIPVVSFTIIMGSFALGYGPIPWIVIPEMVPLKTRSTVVGMATVFNATCLFLITKTFEDLRASLRGYGAFWVYGGFSVLGSVLCWILLPETKGKTLDEIQKHFEKSRSNNGLGEDVPEKGCKEDQMHFVRRE